MQIFLNTNDTACPANAYRVDTFRYSKNRTRMTRLPAGRQGYFVNRQEFYRVETF